MIKVTNLSKIFGASVVLQDINLEIPQGQVVAIIGPSGSGKSTLLRCLNLLEVPNSGEVWIDNDEITAHKAPITRIRQKMGMVFQHFHLFPHMSVLDNVAYALIKVKNMQKMKAQQKARKVLEKVGLAEKVNMYPAKLSGGQKQRVAIARALALDPEIMLFDEPTSALDPEMVKEVLSVMKDLAHTGMTMVIVTHEMGFARQVADRILFLDGGQLLEDASPQEFFMQPKSKRAQRFLSKIL